MRTLTMSTGWMTVVATMPLSPPLMKGRTARTAGVWRKPLTAGVDSFGAAMTSLGLGRAASGATKSLEIRNQESIQVPRGFKPGSESNDGNRGKWCDCGVVMSRRRRQQPSRARYPKAAVHRPPQVVAPRHLDVSSWRERGRVLAAEIPMTLRGLPRSRLTGGQFCKIEGR
ncbi:hypothetical protein B0T18DRAFT_414654 [Schizothecium vesticola]|uniref:Uncharacterized protein n=1 Tax=Schizothecium vesticola TaxID=314040 RepID=A0AA40EPM6_9PEZI|nr:hypothetical protein B0T18DRAFT_414654 [Schizothecium vesticola]